MTRSPLVLLLLAGPLACGVTTHREPLDLTGEWKYNTHDLKGTSPRYSYVCSIGQLTLSLTQSGSTISGTYSGYANANCDPPLVLGSMSGQVVNGVVGPGDAIQFDFDPAGWHHTGTASEAFLEGTVTATLDVVGGPTEFKGIFQVVKQ